MSRHEFVKTYKSRIRQDIFERIVEAHLKTVNKKPEDFLIRSEYTIDNPKRIHKENVSFEEFGIILQSCTHGHCYFETINETINGKNRELHFGISLRLQNNLETHTQVIFYEKNFHMRNKLEKKLQNILKEDHQFKEFKTGRHIRSKLDKIFKRNNSLITIGGFIILILTLLASLGLFEK